MRRFLLILFLLVFVAGFAAFEFGTTLLQEGNPVPILFAIGKLELSNRDYEQFSKNDKISRYVSENTGESRFAVVKEFMLKQEWNYREQIGAGLVFVKEGETIVVGTRQYSKHYILWNVPNEIIN